MQTTKKETKMKKTMIVAAALFAAVVTQVSAMNFSWSIDIFDDNYANTPGLVQMYLADNTFINQAADPGATLFNTATFHQGTVGSGDYNWTVGQQFYFKVYDATTVGAATHEIITSMVTMPNFPTEADTTAKDGLANAITSALDGTVDASNGFILPEDSRRQTITPVPEPASMALFGLGAGVLVLRRRFMKKAKA